jgi:hypothetical protein
MLESNRWQRVVTPAVTANSAKTVDQVQLRVRSGSAIAMTFSTDNGKIFALSVAG